MLEENPQGESPAEDVLPVESSTTTDADSAPETPAAEQPETEEKPKGGFQRRISELTHNWRQAEREKERLLAILEQRTTPTTAPEPAKVEAPPTLEQSGFDDAKYQQAVIAYATRQAEAAVDARLKAYEDKQHVEKRQETFQTRAAEFAKVTEDYEETVFNPSLAINANMSEDIAESEMGPQLAYYLGKNPEIARQIAALPPRAASRELGKIEARLAAPKAAPVASKAPPPPPKIAAATTPDLGAVRTTDPSGDVLSDEEWVKAERKRLSRKGK